jgi:hypothetical protein
MMLCVSVVSDPIQAYPPDVLYTTHAFLNMVPSLNMYSRYGVIEIINKNKIIVTHWNYDLQ